MDTSGINKTVGGIVGQMFKNDADKNSKLSQTEYKAYLSGANATSAKVSDATAQALFNKIDTNQDGSLTETEAQAFLTPTQLDPSSLLSSGTTSSLLEALTQSNQDSANSPPDLITQLLQNYGSNQKKLGGMFSGDA